MARLARQHNDANILALGERLTGVEVARDCLREFLETPFEAGRHQRRVDKLGAPPSASKMKAGVE
jgi:ribose 5-phosphate isomerase B